MITDPIENTFDIGLDILDGKVDNRKVVKLFSDGMNIASIASMLDITEDEVKKLLNV